MARKGAGRGKAQDQLLGAAISMFVVGLGLLALAAFMPGPAGTAGGHALRMVSWLALLLGAAFLAVHVILRRLSGDEGPARQDPQWTAWAPPELLRREQAGFPLTDTPPLTQSMMPDAPPRPLAREPETAWTTKVFEGIEWRRFEAVCERLFAQGGFEPRAQSHGPDGGVDIWLHSRHADGPAAIVQCKHWTKPVGVKEIREFYGVMASRKLQRGTFATTSTFTADALQFAKANGINAMDGARLLALIASRTPEQQAQLLAVAYEGEYWKPTCARCGVKMVERKSSRGASVFWGCVHFPNCRMTLPIRGIAT